MTDQDPAAFFAREHAGAVRLARRIGPAARAEDVAAEAFARLLAHWADVDAPLPYLRRTVRSLIADELRHAAVVERHAERCAPVEPSYGPADDAVVHRDLLAGALRELGPRQRAAVLLRYGLDLPEADVARLMGVRPGTVKSSASRGLGALRRLVDDAAVAA